MRGVNSYQGAAKVIAEFNGSMLRALMDTYPDIGLEKSRFDLINSMLASSSHPILIASFPLVFLFASRQVLDRSKQTKLLCKHCKSELI